MSSVGWLNVFRALQQIHDFLLIGFVTVVSVAGFFACVCLCGLCTVSGRWGGPVQAQVPGNSPSSWLPFTAGSHRKAYDVGPPQREILMYLVFVNRAEIG